MQKIRVAFSSAVLFFMLGACVGMSPAEKKEEPAQQNPLADNKDGDAKNERGDGPTEKPKLDILRDVIFPQIYNVIQQHYVETPDQEKMIEGAINGMLSALDPHSSYMGPKEYKAFKEHSQGSMLGVGIQIVPDRGAIRVIAPIEDTPAYKAGVKPGDYITKIDGEFVFGLSIDEAVRKLKGTKAGTTVSVTIFRAGESIEMTMQREEIKINSVKWGVLENVGYVRISTFDENCAKDFVEAIKAIKKTAGKQLQGIVIDVRSNPGGLLDQCVDICNQLLEGGVVVSSKGRSEGENLTFETKPTGLTKGIPLVVMIDEGAASASEILAAAVQDHKRGLVLGTQSYGKGTVQIVVPFGGKKDIPPKSEFEALREDRAIKLTIARYYTPAGRSIQGKGVVPDIIVEPAKIEKFERNEVFREKDFKNALDVGESERKRNIFFSQEKKKAQNETGAPKATASFDKHLTQERLEQMYEGDYQFLRAIDAVKTLHVVKVAG